MDNRIESSGIRLSEDQRTVIIACLMKDRIISFTVPLCAGDDWPERFVSALKKYVETCVVIPTQESIQNAIHEVMAGLGADGEPWWEEADSPRQG